MNTRRKEWLLLRPWEDSVISQPLGHLFLPITRLCVYFNLHLLHVEIWNPVARLIFFKMPYGVLVAFIFKPFLLSCSVLIIPPTPHFNCLPPAERHRQHFLFVERPLQTHQPRGHNQQEMLICLSPPLPLLLPLTQQGLAFLLIGRSFLSFLMPFPSLPAPRPISAGRSAPSLTWLHGVCQWPPLMGMLQPWSSFLSDEPTFVASL